MPDNPEDYEVRKHQKEIWETGIEMLVHFIPIYTLRYWVRIPAGSDVFTFTG